MKKGLMIILFLSAFSLGEDYSGRESLTLDMEISSLISVVPDSFDYHLKDVAVRMSYYPKEDYRQKVLEMVSEPEWEEDGEDYILRWQEPQEKELEFLIRSRIETNYGFLKVTGHIPFPLWNIPEDVDTYIQESSVIDYNDPEVRKIANELAAGEDDLYEVVFKFADYVNRNISYNLTTKTAQASQSASWTLAHGYGVCDELTSLFLAFCRAVGIPARFVSGVSYTENELFVDRWSPHGWAEVYFPDFGWVPFDVTYGQFGWVDPTHVKFKESIDANRTGTRYEWTGRGVSLKTNQLSITSDVKKEGEEIPKTLSLKSDILKEVVGFGSYNLYSLTIENPAEYYFPTTVFISRTTELELFGPYERNVLLKPKSKKTLFWVVKVDDGLDSAYIYNFTMNAETIMHESSRVSFTGEKEGEVYPRDKVIDYINEERDDRKYSTLFEATCYPSKDRYYSFDAIKVTCILKNTGNTELKGVEVSLEGIELKQDINIGQSKELVFTLDNNLLGEIDKIVTIRAKDYSRKIRIGYKVIGDAQVVISGLESPATVTPDKGFEIIFVVQKNTSTEPRDVKVRLVNEDISKEWVIDNLSVTRRFILTIGPYFLSKEYNSFHLTAEFTNNLGERKYFNRDFVIRQEDLTLPNKLKIRLNKITFSTIYILSVIVIGLIVSILILSWVFRRARNSV